MDSSILTSDWLKHIQCLDRRVRNYWRRWATARVIEILIWNCSVQEQYQPRWYSANTGRYVIDHYRFLVPFSFQNSEYKNIKNNFVEPRFLRVFWRGNIHQECPKSDRSRKIFGPKRDAESEKFTIVRVHNEEFCDTHAYRSSGVGRVWNVKGVRCPGVVAVMGEPWKKKLLRNHFWILRWSWRRILKMDLREGFGREACGTASGLCSVISNFRALLTGRLIN